MFQIWKKEWKREENSTKNQENVTEFERIPREFHREWWKERDMDHINIAHVLTKKLHPRQNLIVVSVLTVSYQAIDCRSWQSKSVSLKNLPCVGEAVQCTEDIIWIIFPGIHIESLNGEQAAKFCNCQVVITLNRKWASLIDQVLQKSTDQWWAST